MYDITRKCFVCKQLVSLNNDNFIPYKDKYYHYDCYIQERTSKRTKTTKEEWIKLANELVETGKQQVNEIIKKECLYKWLQHSYNVVVIPNYFFIKMTSIFDGTYKGLSKGIPPEDLLDMWKQKKSELDKISDFNNRKGNYIDSVGRLQYDLAIILSKYDSYIKWKEKQKVLENEQQEIIKVNTVNKIDFNKISKTVDNAQNKEKSIYDIIDEVF
jgi:hypothetical protein